MKNIEALLVLNQVYSCNAHSVKEILKVVGEPRNLLNKRGLSDLNNASKFGANLSRSIECCLERFNPEKEVEALGKLSVDLIAFNDPRYPSLLSEIYDPPVVLYCLGDVDLLSRPSVSIVGSRYASFYGRDVAERLAHDFSEKGITVVSGMACGIDGAAHKGALGGEGKTIAVLGSGINIPYPKSNEKLYNNIQNQGLIISEYPLSTEPYRYNFPRRNRIISGLSRATIVVEAAKRSGSLITARCALDEGRDVYSVPGKIDSFLSSGTNELIKQGAMLVTSADDIVSDLFSDIQPIPSQEMQHTVSDEPFLSEHSCLEARIVERLSNRPLAFDLLHDELDESRERLHTALINLEVKHKIKRVLSGGYVKTN